MIEIWARFRTAVQITLGKFWYILKTRKTQVIVPHSKCFPNQPPTIQRASPSQNGQPHRQPDNPPGSKTIFCLDFVLITFGCQKRLYLANVCLVVQIFFSTLVSRKLQGRSCGGKLVPCVLVIEVAPASSKLPADVDLRISTGERYGFATSWP